MRGVPILIINRNKYKLFERGVWGEKKKTVRNPEVPNEDRWEL